MARRFSASKRAVRGVAAVAVLTSALVGSRVMQAEAASTPTADGKFSTGWSNAGDVINSGTPADGINNLRVRTWVEYPKNVMVGETFAFRVCMDQASADRFGGLSEYVGRISLPVTTIFGTGVTLNQNWGGPPGGGPLVTAYDGGQATKGFGPVCASANGSLSTPGNGQSFNFSIGGLTADVWECTDVSDPVYNPGVYGCNLWSSIVQGPWTRTNASSPNSGTATINVFPAIQAVDDTAMVIPLGAATVPILSNDTYNPTTTVSIIGPAATNGSCTVTADRKIIYIHTGPGTNDVCHYRLTQPETGVTSDAKLTITVNGYPVAVKDSATVTEDDVNYSIPVTSNDSDPDGDPLSIASVNTTGTQGTATISGGNVLFTPSPALQAMQVGQSTTTTFTYVLSDGRGGTDTNTVTVTINGVNDAPVAVNDSIPASENSPAITIDPRINDSDIDTGDTRTVTAVDTTGTQGTVTFTGTSVTYTPTGYDYLAQGETANTSFKYTITDSQGATAQATVNVTISGTNDVPVVMNDTADVNEDGPAVTVTPLSNDSDPDTTDTLSLQSATLLAGSGTVTTSGNSVTYDPAGNYEYLSVGDTASVVIAYSAVDNHGVATPGTITITVHGQNDLPTAVDDTATANQDGPPVAIDVLTSGINDSDPDQSDTLTVTSITPASAGTATLSGNTVTYDPGTAFVSLGVGQTGTATFDYTISDGQGGTDTATVTVTVFGANDPPIAVNDTATVPEDGPGVDVAVMGNDSDPDNGDSISIFSIGTATHGTLTWAAGDTTIKYTPDSAFYNNLAVGETATDTFKYTIADTHSAFATATVTVTITGVNDAPTAVNDAGATNDKTAISIDVVAPNDTDPDTTDVLTVSSFNAGSVLGAVTLSGNTFSYDPNGVWNQIGTTADKLLFDDQTATESFPYTVSDGHGGTATAMVTITVTGTLSHTADSDGGGVPDWVELLLGTDPANPADDPKDQDTDGGGVPDWIELIQGTDPNDKSDDLKDLDTDGGGVPDWIEIYMGTDPNNKADDPKNQDTDGGGVPDWIEIYLGTDPKDPSDDPMNEDTDGGGVPDWVELQMGTDPKDPKDDPMNQDTDGGGVPDWVEIYMGTDPTNPKDDPLHQDTDGGGVPDWIEIYLGTDPKDPKDDPINQDTDGGGIADWVELLLGTDIHDPKDEPWGIDADGNGIPDWHEYMKCGKVGCEKLPPAPTECPSANNQLALVSGTLAAGQSIVVKARTNWLKFSTVTYYVCSTPTALVSVSSASDGFAKASLKVPSNVDPGAHIIMGVGLAPDGSIAVKSFGWQQDTPAVTTTTAPGATTTTAKGATTTTAAASGATTTTAAATQVAGVQQAAATSTAATAAAKTGSNTVAWLGWAALLLLAGLGLVVTGRRRRSDESTH